MNRLIIFLTIIVCLLAATACKKNKETDIKPNLNAANDIMLAQRPFINAFNILLKAALDPGLQNNYEATIDSASIFLSPDKKIYTFRYYGKRCPDSVIRTGVFEAVLDSSLFLPGNEVRIIFNNFYEDIHSVNGTDSLRYDGPGQDGELVFKNFITGAVITKDTVRIIKWKGEFTFLANPEIISQGTKNAVVMIEGSGEGTSSMGYIFYSFVASSLRDSLNCPWLKNGVITFDLPDGDCKNGSIEFMAKTACNNRINYNFDGIEYHLWLKEKYLVN